MWFFFVQFKEESLKNSLYTARVDKKQTIKSFLDELDLNKDLLTDLVFLNTSYILCYFCKRDSNENPNSINFKKIKNVYKITGISVEKIIHNLQTINAALSCDYIERLIKKLYTNDLSQWLNLQQLVGDLGRKAFSCYVLTKTILDDMLKKQDKLLFIISNQHNQQIELLYQAKVEKFLLIENSDRVNYNVIVFKGITNMELSDLTLFKQAFNEINPYQIVLSNMAKHPQFTGEKLAYLRNCPFPWLPAFQNSEIIEYIAYYQHMLDLAETIGACENNVGLFYIQHIFSMHYRAKSQIQFLTFQEEAVYV